MFSSPEYSFLSHKHQLRERRWVKFEIRQNLVRHRWQSGSTGIPWGQPVPPRSLTELPASQMSRYLTTDFGLRNVLLQGPSRKNGFRLNSRWCRTGGQWSSWPCPLVNLVLQLWLLGLWEELWLMLQSCMQTVVLCMRYPNPSSECNCSFSGTSLNYASRFRYGKVVSASSSDSFAACDW